MTERVDITTAEELVWVDIRDEHGTVRAKAGIPRQPLIHGTPMYVDGYTTAWTSAMFDINGRTTLSPTPFVVLEVPDYPRPDAVTLLIDTVAARAIAASLIRLANEAEHAMDKHTKQWLKESRSPDVERARNQRIREATRCSVEGCNRERRYFDASGKGLCKRHAEEFGTRPKGKVT